jgi:molybdopterin-guanine dinucleotide biosynthesis protein A
MGSDKSMLMLAGKPLIAHIIEQTALLHISDHTDYKHTRKAQTV